MLLHITLPKKDPFNGGNSCNREGDYPFILLSLVHFKPNCEVFAFNAALLYFVNQFDFICLPFPLSLWISIFPYRFDIYTILVLPISCNKNKILNESKKIDRFNLVCVFYVQCLFVIRSSFSSRHGSHPHHLLGRRETPLETSEANNFVPIKITISLSVRLGS